MALRRMAQSKWNVLPVVGRADIRDLKGVVSLNDILRAYGVSGEQDATPARPARRIRASRRLVPGVIAAGLAVLIVIGFLNYYYRSARSERAEGILQDRQRIVAAESRRRSRAAVPQRAVGGARQYTIPAGAGARAGQGQSSGGSFGLFERPSEARSGKCAGESWRSPHRRRRKAKPPMP